MWRNEGPDEILWHLSRTPPPPKLPGQTVRLELNKDRRLATMRQHTVLHVRNSIALQDYQSWIKGVQIGVEYSRIDFKLEDFSEAVCRELERKVNAVLAGDHALRSDNITEAEFGQRADLLRTLEVKPPISHGQVRVVEIEGFDVQACRSTHVHSTAEVGRFSIFRTENKGTINKQLYVRLELVI